MATDIGLSHHLHTFTHGLINRNLIMSTLLKDIYSPAFVDRFSAIMKRTNPNFDQNLFRQKVFQENWPLMELKQRMKHIAAVLHEFLPPQYPDALKVILHTIEELKAEGFNAALEFMFFPHYIETYGLKHFDESVNAFVAITSFTSCEFAVRPFLLHYGPRMIDVMTDWSTNGDHHVRRLASEGIRPRLPWAIALPFLKKDPTPLFPILDNLKNDPSDYVRRSVANNLNDISRDNPAVVIEIARRWKGDNETTDAIIRHATRTLLKQGNKEVLHLFGLNGSSIDLRSFSITETVVKNGGDLQFSVSFRNSSRKSKIIRLEYAVYYLRQKGRISKKVFKISERSYAPGEETTINRKQSFRPITTRRYYPGLHQVSVIINGKEYDRLSFHLD